MPYFLCQTCGVQYSESERPPERCAICDDERQYVGWEGQQWTTPDALRFVHANEVRYLEPELASFKTAPRFAIGQQALLVESPGGNVLWDCLSLLDPATI